MATNYVWSKGLKKIGPDMIIDKLSEQINRDPVSDYVEIGSGNGNFADCVSIRAKISVKTIDPDESGTEFLDQSTLLFRPMYPDIDSYLEDNSNINGNDLCMMIVWPYPDNEYDIDAIERLRPHQLFLIVETSGASGSNNLLQWLHRREFTAGEIFGNLKTTELPAWMDRYNRVFSVIRDAENFFYQAIFLQLDYDGIGDVDYKEIKYEPECIIS